MPNKCPICSYTGFKTWQAYHEHTKLKHNIRPLETEARALEIDFTGLFEQPKQYVKMDRAVKQRIVDHIEACFRATWIEAGHDNPFLGWGE